MWAADWRGIMMLTLLRVCILAGLVALLSACNHTGANDPHSGCCIRPPTSY
jgi:hypothetical protein